LIRTDIREKASASAIRRPGMRPFKLTMESQRLDPTRLWLALVAVALLLGLAWAAWALRAGPADPGRCVQPLAERPAPAPPRVGPEPRCPPDPLSRAPRQRRGAAVFVDADGARVAVDIAETARERARGLMYRPSLADDAGLLRTYPARGHHLISTHNVCVPLDLIFIDDDGAIVGIEEDAPPMDDVPITTPCPWRHAIEVPAGFCRRHGVRPGQRVRLDRRPSGSRP